MNIVEHRIYTKDYLMKSNLPASDYVINPYIGCPHACKYCYARFMKRFTGHEEEWGEFIDVKLCQKPINLNRIKGKSVFLSSVTDCYNSFEEKYGITRSIIEQLVNADCELTISTKSSLILRDIDILKKMRKLKVALSINTLQETFRADMDNASSISDRLDTLKSLHEAGIHTVLFMSPIFPLITDYEEIINQTKDFVTEYWFEDLNLRGAYKKTILRYIEEHYPELTEVYHDIYIRKDRTYWDTLSESLQIYCKKQGCQYVIFFNHTKLVKEKKESLKLR